jgi:lactoylglutathione lyase
MKLNHLNLTVSDVLETHTFFEKYFNLRPMGKANANMAFLRDDNGMVISLFKGEAVQYPDTFHVGFIQDSEAQVNELHQRLLDDGFTTSAPQKFHGSWTFYFQSPGGFTIEVLH